MRRRFLGLILLAAVAAGGLYAYAARTGASAEDTGVPRLSNGQPDLNGYCNCRLPPLTAVRKEGESIPPSTPTRPATTCRHRATIRLLPGFPK